MKEHELERLVVEVYSALQSGLVILAALASLERSHRSLRLLKGNLAVPKDVRTLCKFLDELYTQLDGAVDKKQMDEDLKALAEHFMEHG